jgi:serine/threonine protein phosphatase 1
MNWVIGDIHGMLRPLRALVEQVRRADPDAAFFFVGDYINRGRDSKGVIDFLLTLEGARFARGNHDDIFDQILHGAGYVQNPSATSEVVAFRWFIQHGLSETLESYGVEPYEVEKVFVRPTPDAVAKLFTAVPDSHRQFIRNLLPVIEMPEFFVAHAMWNPDESDEPSIAAKLAEDSRLRYQLIWGRYGRELTKPKVWRRTGYFGHTPVQTYPADLQGQENTPIRGPKIVLLDTAAALTSEGRLTAVCVESGKDIQVDRLGGVV